MNYQFLRFFVVSAVVLHPEKAVFICSISGYIRSNGNIPDVKNFILFKLSVRHRLVGYGRRGTLVATAISYL
ncbi:hypothetical protein [Porticoccus sp.]